MHGNGYTRTNRRGTFRLSHVYFLAERIPRFYNWILLLVLKDIDDCWVRGGLQRQRALLSWCSEIILRTHVRIIHGDILLNLALCLRHFRYLNKLFEVCQIDLVSAFNVHEHVRLFELKAPADDLDLDGEQLSQIGVHLLGDCHVATLHIKRDRHQFAEIHV